MFRNALARRHTLRALLVAGISAAAAEQAYAEAADAPAEYVNDIRNRPTRPAS